MRPRGSRRAITAMFLAFSASVVFAQDALKFEVASIEPSASARGGGATTMDAGRVNLPGYSLAALIMMAYDLKRYQFDPSEWMLAARFDVSAKLPDGATKEQVPAMLQALLAERFKLVVHRETKEQSIVAMIVGKDGPKLKEAGPDAGKSDKPFPNGRGDRLVMRMVRTNGEGVRTVSRLGNRMIFETEKITMPELAVEIQGYVDDPIVDMTGLKGYFEIVLDVPPQRNRAIARGFGAPQDGSAADPAGVSIFSSIKTLGLELQKRKGVIEHLVVDHVEKNPTDN